MAIDNHNLYELELLNHIEGDHKVTNRMVAQKLNVSVRLAHDILTRMVEKGLVHVNVIHSRRWDYFLTPKGILEKARLTMEFFDFSMHFYREGRKRSSQVCKDLVIDGIKEIGFLGAGDLAEIAYLGVQEWNIKLISVFDNDRRKSKFLNIEIDPFSELRDCKLPAIIVCMYDKKQPMKKGYLPPDVINNGKFHWIFG